MDEEIIDNEALFDSPSFSLTRPSSSASSDMPKVNLRSRRSSLIKRQSSNIDVNEISSLETRQTPIKILVVNGKCSQIFKSTLEECVEDCILEFPAEQNSVYVSKTGQTTQIPIGSNRNSISSVREQSANARQSARSGRRRSSINQYNTQLQTGSARSNVTSNLALPSVALAATTSARLRHQLVQQKFSLAEDISEEQTHNAQSSLIPSAEPRIIQSERPSMAFDGASSPISNPDMNSRSMPSFPSNKRRISYRDRQKNYRLSDLVMLGPEHFAGVFNLPRHHSPMQQADTKVTDLDRIKQDLFHRYLWTQKPQVSCRIRPISTYIRNRTVVI